MPAKKGSGEIEKVGKSLMKRNQGVVKDGKKRENAEGGGTQKNSLAPGELIPAKTTQKVN